MEEVVQRPSQKVYGKTLFIIEDDPFFVHLLRESLLPSFEQVHVYNNTQDLLRNLDKQPDVVLLDFYLNDENGVEILKEIKGFDPDIMVIGLSGQNKINNALNFLKYGAFDYIQKDDNCIDELMKTLDRVKMVRERVSQNQVSSKKQFYWIMGALLVMISLLGMVLWKL